MWRNNAVPPPLISKQLMDADTDMFYEMLQKMLRNIPIVQWWNSRGEKVETSTSEQKLVMIYCFILSRWRIVRKFLTFSNFTTTTSTGSREQLRMPPSISIQHFMIRGRKIHFDGHQTKTKPNCDKVGIVWKYWREGGRRDLGMDLGIWGFRDFGIGWLGDKERGRRKGSKIGPKTQRS